MRPLLTSTFPTPPLSLRPGVQGRPVRSRGAPLPRPPPEHHSYAAAARRPSRPLLLAGRAREGRGREPGLRAPQPRAPQAGARDAADARAAQPQLPPAPVPRSAQVAVASGGRLDCGQRSRRAAVVAAARHFPAAAAAAARHVAAAAGRGRWQQGVVAPLELQRHAAAARHQWRTAGEASPLPKNARNASPFLPHARCPPSPLPLSPSALSRPPPSSPSALPPTPSPPPPCLPLLPFLSSLPKPPLLAHSPAVGLRLPRASGLLERLLPPRRLAPASPDAGGPRLNAPPAPGLHPSRQR